MIVGLTGGIATGKSTVTNMLRELGAYVVDADVWARRVVEKGAPALDEIAQAFGPTVLQEDGTLNRPALAAIVFHDEARRQQLNDITHPRVRLGMKTESEARLQAHPNEPIVWDVPLLFEGETRRLVDYTILVYVDASTQKTRLMNRDNLSEAEADARIASQLSIETKRQLADYIIDNRGTLEQTREQVNVVWRTLHNRANQR